MGCCFIMWMSMNLCLNIIPSISRPFFQYYPYVIPSVWCIFRLCACLCNEMKKLFKILSPLKLCNQPRKNLKMILSRLKNEHFKKSPKKLKTYSFPLIPSVSASVRSCVLQWAKYQETGKPILPVRLEMPPAASSRPCVRQSCQLQI